MRILTNPADTPVLDKNPADAYQQRLRNPIDDPSLVPQVTGPIYGHWLPLLVERHPTRVNSCPLRLFAPATPSGGVGHGARPQAAIQVRRDAVGGGPVMTVTPGR